MPDQAPSVSLQQAQWEDAYWQRTFWQERYYVSGFDYEDYAPAYCVGYAGCAQYGGEFADAERSLCANWERIKGDSRLCLEQAMPAIHAAWERMARLRRRQAAPSAAVGLRHRVRRVPAFASGRLAPHAAAASAAP